MAKAYLFLFKFDHIIQDVREGEGSVLADHDTVEVTVNTYKFLENGTIQATDVKIIFFLFVFQIKISVFQSGENKPIKFKIGKNQNGKVNSLKKQSIFSHKILFRHLMMFFAE